MRGGADPSQTLSFCTLSLRGQVAAFLARTVALPSINHQGVSQPRSLLGQSAPSRKILSTLLPLQPGGCPRSHCGGHMEVNLRSEEWDWARGWSKTS